MSDVMQSVLISYGSAYPNTTILTEGFDTTVSSQLSSDPVTADMYATESGVIPYPDGTIDVDDRLVYKLLHIRASDGRIFTHEVNTVNLQDVDSDINETPDAFSFTAQTNVALSEVIESNAITVTGVDAATDIPVSIIGGEYAVSTDGGSTFGAWTSTNTNVQLNHQIKVRLTSSEVNDTEVAATLTVGGVSGVFSVTTIVVAPASAPTFGEPTIGQTTITQPTSYAGGDAESFQYSLGDGNWIAYISPIELTGLSTNQSVTIRSRAVNVGGEGPIATTTLTTLPATGVGTGLSNSITAGATFDVAATPPALEANQALVAFIQHDTDVYWLTINSVGGGVVNVTAPNDLPVFDAGQGVLKIEVREFSS